MNNMDPILKTLAASIIFLMALLGTLMLYMVYEVNKIKFRACIPTEGRLDG